MYSVALAVQRAWHYAAQCQPLHCKTVYGGAGHGKKPNCTYLMHADEKNPIVCLKRLLSTVSVVSVEVENSNTLHLLGRHEHTTQWLFVMNVRVAALHRV